MSLSPGISPKQLIPGMGVNDPPYNRQILPELNSFYQGVCQSYPGGVVVVYAGAPIATRIFFFLLFVRRFCFFRVFFVPLPFSRCTESTSSYVLSFRVVFSFLMTTGWIFGITSCENSITQSINERVLLRLPEYRANPFRSKQ